MNLRKSIKALVCLLAAALCLSVSVPAKPTANAKPVSVIQHTTIFVPDLAARSPKESEGKQQQEAMERSTCLAIASLGPVGSYIAFWAWYYGNCK